MEGRQQIQHLCAVIVVNFIASQKYSKIKVEVDIGLIGLVYKLKFIGLLEIKSDLMPEQSNFSSPSGISSWLAITLSRAK